MSRSLNLDVQIIGCSTEREANGLAKSSRNLLLSEKAKIDAGIIFESMLEARKNLDYIKIPDILENVKNKIRTIPNSKIDYVSIAETSSITPVNDFKKEQRLIILVAVFVENVRLIDNLLLNE